VIPFTRIITVLMFGVICFVLIVPLALQRHNLVIATGISIVFVLYLVANIVLWRRMKPRA
jgi:amino acid transporter